MACSSKDIQLDELASGKMNLLNRTMEMGKCFFYLFDKIFYLTKLDKIVQWLSTEFMVMGHGTINMKIYKNRN